MERSARMTSDEREQLFGLLERSRDDLVEAVKRVSAEQASFRKGDGWSVRQILEHVVLSEAHLLGVAQAAVERGPDPEWAERTKDKTSLLLRVMPSRPEGAPPVAVPLPALCPMGRMLLEDGLAEFRAVRRRASDFIARAEAGLTIHTFRHPLAMFGWLSAYQWLLYMPLHTLRHCGQIAGVRGSEGFPAE